VLSIDSDDFERLVDQGRIAVEKSEEEEYVLFPGISFDTSEELLDFYRENLQRYVLDEDLAVYGNSDELIQSVAERDTWASFRYSDEKGEWAVDVSNTVKKFSRDVRVEPYERAVESLSAATLYAVARAESKDLGPGMYSFHHGLVRYLRDGSEAQIEELAEIESEIEEVEDELEDYLEEKQEIEGEMEQVDEKLDQVEEEIQEVDREIELYEGLIEIFQTVGDVEDNIEDLYNRVEDAEDRSDIEGYIQILQNNIEKLDSRLRNVEYSDRRLQELEEQVDFLEQKTEFQDISIRVENEEVIDTESRLEELEDRNEAVRENIIDIGSEVEDMEEVVTGLEERMQQVEEELEKGHGLTRVWRGTKRWYGRRKQNVRNLFDSSEE